MVMAAAAFVLRAAFLLYNREWQFPPEDNHWAFGFEMGRVASSIAAGKGFSSPLIVETGPTAWLPPVYPCLLGGIFWLFGTYSTASAFVALALNCALSALTVLPVYAIARRLFGGSTAILAGWAWAWYPQAIITSRDIWDTTLNALLVTVVCACALAMPGVKKPGRWAAFGLVCGVATLSGVTLLAVLPALGLWLVWSMPRPAGWWKLPLAAAVVFALTLGCWSVRNRFVFGQFILVRSNFGLEFYRGTLDAAQAAVTHPSRNPAEFQQYTALGELEYMKEKRRQALESLRASPSIMASRTLGRFMAFWLGPWVETLRQWREGRPGVSGRQLIRTGLSALALAGLFVALRRRIPGAGVPGLFFLFYPVIVYVTNFSPRFRLPIDPLFVVLAAYAWFTLWARQAGTPAIASAPDAR
jgi:4-amino-4-deoxy-L-arabinose transferase-like glycosyltransferase